MNKKLLSNPSFCESHLGASLYLHEAVLGYVKSLFESTSLLMEVYIVQKLSVIQEQRFSDPDDVPGPHTALDFVTLLQRSMHVLGRILQ